MRRQFFFLVVVSCLGSGCARERQATVSPGEPSSAVAQEPGHGQGRAVVASGDSYERGLRALEDEADPARAVSLFGRYLADQPDGGQAGPAYLGLARSHERLGDFQAAARAYQAYLSRFPSGTGSDATVVFEVHARKGACEAELSQWERSAQSYAAALEVGGPDGSGLLPSQRVEALARRGYALFEAGQLDAAAQALEQADRVFEDNEADQAERFSTFYFVGMTRFYRAAVLHVRFREVQISLPEKKMAKDFERKLALLVEAQDAYNRAIAAKHVYWVSASGFQLGSLFEEFYDELMYAPVPQWLDDGQRRVYYEELKKQLRPVVNKAVWVFEKNLETARTLGYENQFIDGTHERLARLQGILLSGDATLGKPHPRLAPQADSVDPEAGEAVDLSPADAKLFVPFPTPL